MHRVDTDIEINASAERVWSLLMDFRAYGRWNPFVRSVEGEAVVGRSLKVVIRPPGSRAMRFRPVVVAVEPNRELRWKGKLVMPGLFDGEHFFRLEAGASGGVIFHHGEVFSGLLVPLLRRSLDGATRQGFIAMNEALKMRAEQPPGWKLAHAELLAEMRAGKRKSVGRAEMEWAKEYERSLIPAAARFPRKGDLYESLRDQSVGYVTAWAAPYSGGGEAALLKGERVWIHADSAEEEPVGAYALAVEYDKLEERIVPREEREAQKYGGFCFYLSTVDLNRNFRLVKTAFKGKSRFKGQ